MYNNSYMSPYQNFQLNEYPDDIEQHDGQMIEKPKQDNNEQKEYVLKKNVSINIALANLIQLFSTIPHSLSPQFLAPYSLFLLIKKINCQLLFNDVEQKCMLICYCSGCSLVRKYNKYFDQNKCKSQQVRNYLKQFKVDWSDFSQLSQKQKIKTCKEIEEMRRSKKEVQKQGKGQKIKGRQKQLKQKLERTMNDLELVFKKQKQKGFDNNLQQSRSGLIFLIGIKWQKLYEKNEKLGEWRKKILDVEKVEQANKLIMEMERIVYND